MNDKQPTEQSVCRHADVALLRDAQLADDEIQVMVLMATSGRCPLCHSERHDEYVRAVQGRRS